MRKQYPSDLTDIEWAYHEPLIPATSGKGRKEDYTKRSILNGIFYLVRSGCAWRMMPNDLPPWGICYHYFSLWKHGGVWESLHERLRDIIREQNGKKKAPPLRLSTRKVLKLLTTEASVAMMLENGSSGGKDTYSWIRSA
jgi:putative transposase